MLTLAEYLRELKLMKKQYGQEEDLYPLIYMLLHGKDNMKHLSLRMVANCKSAKEHPERALFFGYSAFPDMVVLSEEFDKDNPEKDLMYGCIEVKPFYKDKGSNKTFTGIVFELLNANEDGKTLHIDKYDYETSQKEYIKYVTMSFEKCESYKGIKFYKNITEFVSELLWYGKVLYTDGIIWKYIEKCNEVDNSLNEAEDWRDYAGGNIEVRCIEIGNLKEIFYDIKSADEVDKQVVLHPDWQQEWERLNNNLTCIDWTGTNDISKFKLNEGKNANQTNTP